MKEPRVTNERLEKLLATIADYTAHGRKPALTIDAELGRAMAEDLIEARENITSLRFALVETRLRFDAIGDAVHEALRATEADARRLCGGSSP